VASYAPKYALIYGVPQGSIIDRIDYNMEKTAEQTAAGKEELTKAERSHRRSPAMSVLFYLSFFPLFFGRLGLPCSFVSLRGTCST
jgi:hypothetical protein